MDSLIYAQRNEKQTVPSADTINLGTVEKQIGDHIQLQDGSAYLTGSGLFAIDVALKVHSIEAVTITIFVNGRPFRSCTGSGEISLTALYYKGPEDVAEVCVKTSDKTDISKESIMIVKF